MEKLKTIEVNGTEYRLGSGKDFLVVTSLPPIAEADTDTVYLIQTDNEDGDKYDEYIVINGAYERVGKNVSIDLSGYASKEDLETLGLKVDDFERDYGKYEELPDVALTPETSGQYIDENGKYIAAEGWAVASIGEVTMGNKYELDMKSADNMVLGVAVYVSRVRVYNASGDVIKTTLTPLFSAKNTNVPKSGYLVLNAYDTYADVLVCYKPALTTSLKVRRYGDTASTATQIRNLRQDVDLRAFADSYCAGFRSGLADNLAARGEEYPVEFGGSRKAGGSVQIEEGTADVKRIIGNTVVYEGELRNNDVVSVKCTGANLWDEKWEFANIDEEGIKTPNPKGQFCSKNFITIKGGEQYYFPATGVYNNVHFYDAQKNYISRARIAKGVFSAPSNAKYILFRIETATPVNGICINISDESFNGTYEPYTESVRVLPTKKYFPDGLRSAGNTYDEMTPTKAITRVGARTYQEGDENDDTLTTDGVNTHYPLAEPIEEEYDELNLSYNVHPLGIESVTFNNTDGKPNVYKASHVYSMDAYNTIVSNRKRIEALEQVLANIANNTNLQNVE